MTETVILSIIGGVVTILTALIGKLSFDVSRTKKHALAARSASEKTENSINNRPTTLSDRLDGVSRAVAAVAATQKDQGKDIRGLQDTAQQTRRTLGQLRGEDRIARQETEQLRQDLTDHVEQTAPMLPMLHDLHTRYGQKLPD